MDNVENPVESDLYLPKGEIPFTNFGHGGRGFMDIRVFLQDVYWVNIEGIAFRLDELSTDYLNNILVILFENAETHFATMAKWYALELMSIMSGVIYTPWEYAEKTKETATEMLLSTPHEWLNSSLLVVKILALLDEKEK